MVTLRCTSAGIVGGTGGTRNTTMFGFNSIAEYFQSLLKRRIYFSTQLKLGNECNRMEISAAVHVHLCVVMLRNNLTNKGVVTTYPYKRGLLFCF